MGIIKEAGIQIFSGGSAGFVEVCIMHPLDLVKTRFQIQTKAMPGDPHYYNGVVDCMRKMHASEGFFSFWKGVLPPILVETPKRAVKFFTFEQYKRAFLFGSPTPTPVTFSLAGLSAGITEAVLVNPFERVKVRLQADRQKLDKMPTTWAVTKEIIRQDGLGLRGLNKGITATMARNGLFNMVYFGFYHSIRPIVPQPQNPKLTILRNLGIGFTSGVLGSLVNIPFDVAKSRIQGPQPVPGEVKYRTTLGSIATVYREEGFRALYKGLFPKVLRLGPGGAIMLIVYEHVHDLLRRKFPD